MSVASLPFALFVLAALAVHHGLPRRWQVTWLLVVSCVFYASWAWQFVVVMLAVAAANHLLGGRIVGSAAHRRGWLVIGVVANLAVLVSLRLVPLARHPIPLFAHLVILGASFYVLRAISYLTDLSTGRVGRTSFRELALYLGYFPTLVAGPIERAEVFVGRLRSPRMVDDQTVGRCLALILLGMTRKLLIADPLAAMLPARAFVAPATLDGSTLAWAIVGYAFHLYNDFAGYTAIVRGTSGLFGIPLGPNFRRPFFARSFTDFWSRWHVSLAHWLRDYVYLPLSRVILRRWGGLRSIPNLVVPPLVTMLLCGAWHGAAPGLMPSMLVWGGAHGLFLIAERALAVARGTRPGREGGGWHELLRRGTVFGIMVLSLVPFRMTLPVAVAFGAGLVRWSTLDGSPWPMLIPAGLSLGLDWVQERRDDEIAVLAWPRVVRATLAAVVLLACFLVTRGAGDAPFVYQAF